MYAERQDGLLQAPNLLLLLFLGVLKQWHQHISSRQPTHPHHRLSISALGRGIPILSYLIILVGFQAANLFVQVFDLAFLLRQLFLE